MRSIFDTPSVTISNGRPERKDVTARLEEWKKRQDEEDLKNESLPLSQRTLVYHPGH